MPFQQDLTGLIEPAAKTWLDATPEQRLWYYQQMAKLAERRKRVELMQAIGRYGVMTPRKHPRADGASGPVMDPHGGLSRAYKLLASSATASSCKLFWRAGGAVVSKSGTVYFTDILGYHANGLVRGAPIRDVRLGDDSIATLQREGEGIWRRRPKQSGATSPKSSATQPTKLSTKGPTQQGGNPFRSILPPKVPKLQSPVTAKAKVKAPKAPKAPKAAKTQPAPTPYTQTPEKVAALRARLAAYTEGDAKLKAILDVGSAHAERSDEVARRKAALLGVMGSGDARAIDAARRALDEAEKALKAVEGRTRAGVMAILGLKPGEGIALDDGGSRSSLARELTQDSAEAALYWVSAVVKAHDPAKPLAFRFAPTTKEDQGRAYYLDGVVNLPSYGSTRAAVHEIGHMLEGRIPGWNNAAQAFLKLRVGDEPLTRMRDTGAALAEGYEKDEYGRKDRFDEFFGDEAWYVGKDYGFTASEVTSMGLQSLFTDPVNFARKDPEYAKFMIGLLDGSLR